MLSTKRLQGNITFSSKRDKGFMQFTSFLVAFFFIVTPFLMSCGDGGGDGADSEVSGISDLNGVAKITTDDGIPYEFSIVDENEQALQGIKVSYSELDGKRLFVIYDESNTYTSAIMYGSDDDFSNNNYLASGSNNIKILSEPRAIGLTIFALVSLASLTYAMLKTIEHGYKMDTFYLADYQMCPDGDPDNICYCKSGEEIADFFIARKNFWFEGIGGQASVFLGFASATAQSAKHGIQITKKMLDLGRDPLVNTILDEYYKYFGTSLGENDKVRVYYKNYKDKIGIEHALGGIVVSDEICGDDDISSFVAYYPFNGDASDETGNGNDGTVYGATLTTDRFGNADSAYYFDGSNDWIEVADDDSLDLIEFTVSAWYRVETGSSESRNMILIKGGRSTDGNGSDLNYNLTTIESLDTLDTWLIRGGFEESDGTDHAVLTDYNYDSEIWYFVAITYDSQKVNLYIDGDFYGSTPTTAMPNNNVYPLLIGRSTDPVYPSNKYWFKGVLDEVRIYNRALSESEILDLYNLN